jgi:hypothetical protein
MSSETPIVLDAFFTLQGKERTISCKVYFLDATIDRVLIPTEFSYPIDDIMMEAKQKNDLDFKPFGIVRKNLTIY